MRIAVPKETAPGERRVALVPESCKKLMQAGYEIAVEAGAGDAAGYPDAAYREVGRRRRDRSAPRCSAAPTSCSRSGRRRDGGRDEVGWMRPGAIYLGSLMPLRHLAAVRALAARQVTAFATDAIPRTTRAQIDGHALVHGQHRRLQGRAARRGRAQQVLPDAHDRRRHGAAGQGVRDRRRRRRPSGHRHRQAARRQRRRPPTCGPR